MYILFVVFILLLITLAVILTKDSQKISTRSKVSLGISFVALICITAVYTILQDEDSKKFYEILDAFERGESISCEVLGKEMIITKQEFVINEGGIKYFEGKIGTPSEGVRFQFSEKICQKTAI